MSDYNLKITTRNGRILRLMREAGYETQTALAKACATSHIAVNAIITMRHKPKLLNGEWSETVMRMAAALRCMPDDMFTETQATGALVHNTFEVDMTEGQFTQLTGSSEDMERLASARMVTDKLINGLPDERMKSIVRAISEGETHNEIGQTFGISGGRVAQIEAQAFRRMRYASRKYLEAERLGYGEA